MGYTERQKIYAEYMLKKIGLSNDILIQKYLIHLEFLFGEMVPRFEYYKNSMNGRYVWYYTVKHCIKNLIDEIDLKKNKSDIKIKPIVHKRIAATELANYCYCPIAFSISSSFEIEKVNGIEFSEIGKQLHEDLILLNQNGKISDYESEIINKPNYFKNIKSSKIIFTGHGKNSNNFLNNSENWIGAPDYIFQDNFGKYFIVEEKFQKYFDPSKKTYSDDAIEIERNDEDDYREWFHKKKYFFNNHQVQTYSYVRNITDFNIEYGYLIYWYYWFDNGNPYVHRVEIQEINKNEYFESLYINNLNGIKTLLKTGCQKFSTNDINPNKCAGCIVTKYCTHKSGKFDQFYYPYSLDQIKLFPTKFPEELRKKNKDESNIPSGYDYAFSKENDMKENQNKSGFSPKEEKEILNLLFNK